MTTTCQNSKLWSVTHIPDPCECKSPDVLMSHYFTAEKLKIIYFFQIFPKKCEIILGSHCVSPPPAPSASKLALSWVDTDPPAHGETVWYRCNAGNSYNRLETDFSKTGYSLTCLEDNKFSTPSWPVCIDSKVLQDFWSV